MNPSKPYINRELSWLAFNRRVLLESLSPGMSAVERLKFSAIFSSNLDEFFMVRVGSLVDQVNADFNVPDPSGMTPSAQLDGIMTEVGRLLEEQEDICQAIIALELPEMGFNLINNPQLTEEDRDFLRHEFITSVYPVLTPMAVDYTRPFPLILNRSLNIAVLFQDIESQEHPYDYATVQVPSVLPRFVQLRCGESGRFVRIEDVIRLFISELFQGRKPMAHTVFRITRNADLDMEDEGAEDLLTEIEASLKRRKWGEVVRLELEHGADPILQEFLAASFEVSWNHIFHCGPFLDMTALFGLNRWIRQKKDDFKPVKKEWIHEDFFTEIRHGDMFFHHPYDDFSAIVEFIEEASRDKNVLAIKQVLYRVSGDSPVVKALAGAAEMGKQVTVLVELQARFDEENNIQWAKRLEKTGCHVIYGYPGLKTHAKICLVVRREGAGIRRYVHLSTGNYNDQTAGLYTDMAIITANETIAHDASKFFNMLSGFARNMETDKLLVAPDQLRAAIVKLIDREILHAKNGKKAMITAKMNSLVDLPLIEKLYEASQAGVKIDLIIRGICCLVPGVPKISANIRVISVVGKYLEHSRIFRFENHGEEEIYLSSADWMPRNLNRRIELMFPVLEDRIRKRISRVLKLYLKGTENVSLMETDGSYRPLRRDGEGFNPQKVLEAMAGVEDREFVRKADKFLGEHP